MKLRLLLSLSISLLFLTLFLYLVPIGELISVLRGVSPEEVIFAFLLYTASQVTRSLRWRSILRGLSLKDIFLINSANIFMNNLLPARTGEISWFFYARRLGVDLKASTWSFIVGRAYDLLGLVSLTFLIYSLTKGYLTALLCLGSLVVLSLLIPFLRELLPPAGRLSDLKEFLRKEFSPSLSLKLLILSTLSFFLKSLSVYTFAGGLGLLEFTLAFAGGELTSVLPFHSLMGYGTYETGFLLPLKVLGHELKDSLKVGFVAHSFLLLSSALWGILSIGLLHTRRAP